MKNTINRTKSPITLIKEFKGYTYISCIKQANRDINNYWFDKDTMKSFNCRVLETVYKKQLFISSEKYNYDTDRLYTVRFCDSTGSIGTIGDFNKLTKYQAEKLIKTITIPMLKIIEMQEMAFNKGKYYKQVKAYINKNIEAWNTIAEEGYISDWIISFVNNKILKVGE